MGGLLNSDASSSATGLVKANRPGSKPLIVVSVSIVLLLLLVSSAVLLLKQKPGEAITGFISKAGTEAVAEEVSEQAEAPVGEAAEGLRTEEVKQMLLQEAKEQKVEVNDTTVDSVISANLKAYEVSQEDFVQYLGQNNLTYDQYKSELKLQLAIAELVNKNVDLQNVTVSDDEVNAFIEQNGDSFEDLLEDEGDAEILKSRIKGKLLQDKQSELIAEYVESLR